MCGWTSSVSAAVQKRRPRDSACMPISAHHVFNHVAQAKAQWQAAIDALPQLVCVVDLHGRVVRANRILEDWGVGDVRQVRGQALHPLLHPACHSSDCYLAHLLYQSLQPTPRKLNQPRLYDVQLQRHVQVQSIPFIAESDESSQPMIMFVFDDHGARLRAERRVAVQEQKLQLLVEFSSDMILRLRSGGTLLYVSPAARSVLGVAPELLRGSNLFSLMHPADQEAARQRIGALGAHGELDSLTCRVRRSDGGYVWLEINSQMMIGSSDEGEIVSVARDVRARKQAEELAMQYQSQLEETIRERTRQLNQAIERLQCKVAVGERDRAALEAAERRYNMLIENTLTGIYMSDGERLMFCNERFARIFGYRQDEMCAMDMESIGAIKGTGMLQQNMSREEVIEVSTKDGVRKWLNLSRARFYEGGRSYILGNVIDVSEQVQASERVLASEHELRALSAQLLETQESERKRISNELHDGLGQRLSAIKFVVEDVQRAAVEHGHTEQVERLAGIIQRIRDAIEEIRCVSMELRPSMLDDLGLIATLGWFVREYGQLFRGLDIHKELSVSEDDIPEHLKVVIFRIVQEALHNISKHAAADAVSVVLRRESHGLQLTIRDNGIGFDYRRAAAMAAGLGLKSMHERAELTAGMFVVNSGPGEGTEITVSWQ